MTNDTQTGKAIAFDPAVFEPPTPLCAHVVESARRHPHVNGLGAPFCHVRVKPRPERSDAEAVAALPPDLLEVAFGTGRSIVIFDEPLPAETGGGACVQVEDATSIFLDLDALGSAAEIGHALAHELAHAVDVFCEFECDAAAAHLGYPPTERRDRCRGGCGCDQEHTDG